MNEKYSLTDSNPLSKKKKFSSITLCNYLLLPQQSMDSVTVCINVREAEFPTTFVHLLVATFYSCSVPPNTIV